jgi:aminocarboxymuconate-semialdehyde decarboxylase
MRMSTRRQFLSRGVAGVMCACCGVQRASAQAPAARREVRIGGQRVRTVDIHCHCAIPDVLDIVNGTSMERAARQQLTGNLKGPPVAQRLAERGADGIDVEAMSINPFWYGANRDMARRVIDLQNQKLSAMCKEAPENLRAFASVALQFPDLAAEQLEHAVKNLGLCGAAIGGSVNGEEISLEKYDPFWKKAEELQALVFIHPQSEGAPTTIRDRVRGSGALSNVIGNPLETTFALAHLIFDGTLDKFPNLKICGAHGGGYLPSYGARMDYGCSVFPAQCKGPVLKKRPSEYLKQIYVDSLVFTGEALRHLVAECGAGQVMIGTDYAVPWVKGPVDHVLSTPGLSDADKVLILGGTAGRLLRL